MIENENTLNIPDRILTILACPDDHSDLKLDSESLKCINCKREFSINNNLIDLRPNENFNVNNKDVNNIYKSYYENLSNFGEGGEEIGTFGIEMNSISSGFVNETLKIIKKYFSDKDIVCDIGAGSGDYSIELAKKSKYMLHCDLDINGIKISQENAKKRKINNIYFLYCDYFKLPFKTNSIDFLYSIDIFERGKEHENKLLNEIERIIKKKSKIIIDFHSKERKKLTRVENKALFPYSKEEIQSLIHNFEFKINEIIGTGFIPQLLKWSEKQYKILNPIARSLYFPPARWLVIFTKNQYDSKKME